MARPASDRTMGNVLRYVERGEVFTDATAMQLGIVWSDLDAQQFADMDALTLADELFMQLPSEMYTARQMLEIAGLLRTTLAKAGFNVNGMAALATTAAMAVPAATVADDSWLAKLRACAQPNMTVSASNGRAKGGVCRRLVVSGSNTEVRGVIVLEGGVVSGSNVEGHVFAPPGVFLDVRGANSEVEVRHMPAYKLAKKAGLA